MCCQSLELDSRKDAKHAITYKKTTRIEVKNQQVNFPTIWSKNIKLPIPLNRIMNKQYIKCIL